MLDAGCWNGFRARIAAAFTALHRRADILMLQGVTVPKDKDMYISSGYVAWFEMVDRAATRPVVMMRNDIPKDRKGEIWRAWTSGR